MDFYKYERDGRQGILSFPASVWLNLLTETELLAFSRSSTQIIADTALLMSKRDWVVDVTSTRFNDVMTACVAEDIFTDDRVAQFKRGVIQVDESAYKHLP